MLMYVSLDLKDVSVSKNTTEELIMNKRTTPEGKNTTEGRKVYTLVQMNGVRFFQDCAKCGQPTMPTSERTCPTLFSRMQTYVLATFTKFNTWNLQENGVHYINAVSGWKEWPLTPFFPPFLQFEIFEFSKPIGSWDIPGDHGISSM